MLPLIHCYNRTNENCKGEFVLTIYDTCYFLYKVNFTYYNSDTNDLCMKKNQTEVDLPTKNADLVLLYVTEIFKSNVYKVEIPESVYVPWKYFSKCKFVTH